MKVHKKKPKIMFTASFRFSPLISDVTMIRAEDRKERIKASTDSSSSYSRVISITEHHAKLYVFAPKVVATIEP